MCLPSERVAFCKICVPTEGNLESYIYFTITLNLP